VSEPECPAALDDAFWRSRRFSNPVYERARCCIRARQKLARSGSVRRCKICGSFMGVKRTPVVASGLRLGGHFSLEVVDSTRPKPRHARHLRGAETRGEFARSSGTTNLSVAISSTVTT